MQCYDRNGVPFWPAPQRLVFFDAHGGAWTPWESGESLEGVVPFGPAGPSRPLTTRELIVEGLYTNQLDRIQGSPYEMASRAGRVVRGEWDTLGPPRPLFHQL